MLRHTAAALGAVLCSALLAVPASSAPVEVDASGDGTTREEAVAHALASAVAQVSGAALSAVQSVSTNLSANASDDGGTVTLSQEEQSGIQSVSGGFVRSYRIEAVEPSGPGQVTARLHVTVEMFKAKTSGAENRRRIAVAAFVDGAGGRANGAALRDRITADLVQGRKFAVVDRSNDAAYNAEMALLQAGDAPLTERVGVGQVIGADYVVVGKLRTTAATHSERTIALTGEVVVSTTPGSMAVDFQVIEIATRQVSWAGSAHGSGLDQLAGSVVDDIMQAIYPIRLIRFDDPSSLILNQGGGTLRTGQRFRAFALGEALVDPYTNEPLGQAEQQVGVIEVTRVDTKLSYARVVSGKLPLPGGDPPVQIVLRPVAAEVAAPRRVPSSGQMRQGQGPASTVVKLPFDK
jgi:curli biogenesis system outer membrane secretion channel CsgG